MKAAVINKYGDPDVFEIIDVREPLPKEHEVMIRVYASSINPVDWKLRNGNWRFLFRGKFPVILGFDASGKVIKVGNKVTKFKPGDTVISRLDRKFGGAYAEYAVGSESTFSLIPAGLTYEQAAALPLAGVYALQALRDKGKISKDKKVLINGASGGVGHFAVQLAKILGGEVTAITSHRHKQMMDELKPDRWIDYTKQDFLCQVDKYDIIFDVVGNKNFFKCKHILKRGGIYITSLPRPKLLIHKGYSLFTGKKVKGFLMKSKASDLDLLCKFVEEGSLKIYVDQIFNLSEISKAHHYSQSGRAEGKIVVRI